jgi:arylsulfatase A-like enzyme
LSEAKDPLSSRQGRAGRLPSLPLRIVLATSRLLLALALGLAFLGCPNKPSEGVDLAPSSPSAAPRIEVTAPDTSQPKEAPVLDFLALGDTCSAGHRGVLLDLGGPMHSLAHAKGGTNMRAESKTIESEGATWLRVTARELSVPFRLSSESDLGPEAAKEDPSKWTPKNDKKPASAPAPGDKKNKVPLEPGDYLVEVRAHGGAAKGISVSLNGKSVGGGSLVRGESKTVRIRSRVAPMLGENELTIRFFGQAKGSDTSADIDWVRIARFDEDLLVPAATIGNLVSTSELQKDRKRAISMRGDSFVACTVSTGGPLVLRGFAGVTGAEEAEVRFVVMEDQKPTQELARLTLSGGRPWQPVELKLSESEGIREIRMETRTLNKGTRVLLGELAVYPERTQPPVTHKPSKNVVLIVLGSLNIAATSVAGGKIEMPALGSVVSNAFFFDDFRAGTNVAHGNLASMLSGTPARHHGVREPLIRLPKELHLISSVVRQAKLQSAMFTGNPLTSAAYGFDRDFGSFAYFDPTDNPASKPFTAASDWIGKHADERFFVTIHTRGGHFPWDTTREQLKEMPPQKYNGSVDPSHMGTLLLRLRKQRSPKLSENDRTRLWALYAQGLIGQDAALGDFLSALRNAKLEEDTMLLIVSDAGVSDGNEGAGTDAPPTLPKPAASAATNPAPGSPPGGASASDPVKSRGIPFQEAQLDQQALRLLLVMRATGSANTAGRVNKPVAPEDIATTIVSSLGLALPEGLTGRDLRQVAAGVSFPRRLRSAAGADASAFFSGPYVLERKRGSARFCDTGKDPHCATEARAEYPIAFFDALVRASKLDKEPALPRSLVSLDFPLVSGLGAWGLMESK